MNNMGLIHRKKRLHLEYSVTSIFIVPFFTVLLMNLFILRAIYTTKIIHGMQIGVLTIFTAIIWGVIFFVNQTDISRNQKAKSKIMIDFNLGLVAIIAFFLAVYFTYVIWGSGYLTLSPFGMIDNGIQHRDTLFHSSISESYKRSVIASTLLNDEKYLAYHTFSHFLLGNISKIMNIPSIVGYCFIYPPVFIPLYFTSQMVSISMAKDYFTDSRRITGIDLMIVSLFNVGIPYNELYGAGTSSNIISESFMIANMISFFSIAFIFYILKNYNKNTVIMTMFCIFIIPIEIFVISWSKISVGLLFTTAVLYYIFRKKTKNYIFWILNIWYLAVFLLSLRLFNGDIHKGSSSVSSGIVIFAYQNRCKGIFGIWGHFLICSLMAIIFIVMEIKSHHYSINDILEGKTIWIEMIIVVGMIAFLPPLLLDIPGGSAAYFSMAYTVISLCILCGHNSINLKSLDVGSFNWFFYCVCFISCIWIISGNTPGTIPTHMFSLEHKTNISDTLLKIRGEVEGNQDKYTIFLDRDAFTVKAFEDIISAVYVCPALTGVGVVNATYYQNGQYYSFSNDILDTTYGINYTDNDHNLSLKEALIKAKAMGKEKVIHIMASGYEFIDVNC